MDEIVSTIAGAHINVSSVVWTLLIICICSFVVNLIIKQFFSTNTRTPRSETDDSDTCESPNCVRCKRQAATILRARTKLTYFTTENADDAAQKTLMSDLEKSYNGDVDNVSLQRPCVFRLSALPSQPFFDVEQTGLASLKQFTQRWEDIQMEFDALYRQFEDGEMKHWLVNKTPSGRWAICHLVDQGRPSSAVELCPITWSLVKACPDIMLNSVFGNVAFSVVFPGTNIASHFGATNIRLRCHLGRSRLLRSASALAAGLRGGGWCRLHVAGGRREWSPGRLLLFDDSFRHAVLTSPEVCLDSGGRCKATPGEDIRVVLLFDIWHPNLSSQMREMLSFAFSADP